MAYVEAQMTMKSALGRVGVCEDVGGVGVCNTRLA